LTNFVGILNSVNLLPMDCTNVVAFLGTSSRYKRTFTRHTSYLRLYPMLYYGVRLQTIFLKSVCSHPWMNSQEVILHAVRCYKNLISFTNSTIRIESWLRASREFTATRPARFFATVLLFVFKCSRFFVGHKTTHFIPQGFRLTYRVSGC
jgi:hypothetical protein